MDLVDYLWLIFLKFDGWVLIGAWAAIGTNTVPVKMTGMTGPSWGPALDLLYKLPTRAFPFI